ncbi:hypothetical protein D6789_01195 [Candidatus Woesearchaeota archaeon]|nr:MAG: hypothetical protein D6789_01195 [Candidatus Woesearchaeota archaeon]
MAGENVQDMILQAVMLVLIGLAFFLAAINNSDPTQYFLRFYAKDLGTTVDTVMASRGSVTLNYRSIRPQDEFIFDFSPHYVRLSAQKTNGSVDRILWRVLQYYGSPHPQATPRLEVLPDTLYQPFSITINRNPSQVRFDNNPGPACAGAENAIPKKDTSVFVTGAGAIANQVRKQLNDDGLLAPPVISPGPLGFPTINVHRYILRLDVRQFADQARIAIGGGPQADLSEDLGCLLRASLKPFYNLTQGPGPVTSGIHVSLIFPPSDEELRINSTAQAVSAAVAAFLET